MRGLGARPFGNGGVTPRLTRTSYIGSRIQHARVLSTCWTTNASLTAQPRARTLARPPEFVRCPTSNLREVIDQNPSTPSHRSVNNKRDREKLTVLYSAAYGPKPILSASRV